MIKLGDATNLTGTEGAETLAKFMNISGTASEDVDRLGATIVNLGNNFATTEDDIARMALRMAAAGEQIGASEPEVLGLATALSSVGIEAEAGGSAFSKLMINMNNASAIGKEANDVINMTGMSLRDLQMLSDSDSAAFREMAQSLGYTSEEFQDFVDASATLEKFSEVTGMTSEEFNKAFGEDAVGTMQIFLNKLGEMDGSDALVTLNDMGIKEIRLRNAILSTSNAMDNFNRAMEIANEGWEENIALDNEANQRYGTTESRMKMVKNQFIDAGITLKEEFQPAIDGIIEGFSEFATWLKWIAKNGKTIAGIIISVGAAIGTFLLFANASSIVYSLVTAIGALNAVLIANPVGIVMAAIVGLVAAFVYFWNTSDEFRQFWIDLWDNIKSVAIAAWTTIKNFCMNAWNAIKGFFSGALSFIKSIWGGIVSFFSDIWEGIKAIFSGIAKWVYDNVIKPLIDFWSPVFTFFEELFNNIIGFAEGCWIVIKYVWAQVSSWFNDNVIKPVGKFFSDTWDNIKSGASTAWNKIKEVWGKVTGWFDDNIVQPVGKFFSDTWDKIKSGASEAWEGIKSVFSPVANWFEETFSKAWQKVKDVFSTGGKIFDGIKEGIEDTFKTVVNGLIDGINKVISVPFNAMNSAIRTIKNISIGGIKPFEDKLSEFTVPQIPKLEKGGVLKKGQIGLLEGNGAEAVIPLDKNKAWIRAVAKDMKKEFGLITNNNVSNQNNAQSINYTQIINAPKQPSRIELYRQTRNLLNFTKGEA